METATIIVKIAGAGLLIWTIWSIAKHFQQRKVQAAAGNPDNQSVSEQILNNILLYLWLAFMIVFSGGMILNN